MVDDRPTYAIVMNNWETYSSYKSWAFENFPQEMLQLWNDGWVPEDKTVGRVVAMGKHNTFSNTTLVGLLFPGHVVIIGEEGIEKFQIPEGI